jgi:hypothetical protein
MIQNRIQTPEHQGQNAAMAGVFEPLNAVWKGFSTGWHLPGTWVDIVSCTTRSSITTMVLPGRRWALCTWRPPPR